MIKLSLVAVVCCMDTSPANAGSQGTASSPDTAGIVENTIDRPAKGIQDNSFLVEEAYNQEDGVIQSFAIFKKQGRDHFLAFTQEFPLGGQLHQISYTVPYLWLRPSQKRTAGIGDIYLNYRYQALFENEVQPAFAPRVSFILPTGKRSIGTGSESSGVQVNLPLSRILNDRVTVHANAGLTSLFDVLGRTPISLNIGGSVVYALTRDFNFLVEALGERIEEVNEERKFLRKDILTLSPGMRFAINMKDAQIVVGAGAPITSSYGQKPSYGAILYLSVESKFFK